MKKQLLIVTLFASGLGLQAQQSKMQRLNNTTFTGNIKSVVTKKQVFTGTEQIASNGTPVQAGKSVQDFPEQTIATTTYDLQTNSSIGNRFIRNTAGEMIYVFTYSQEAAASPYNDRGTGYVANLTGTWDSPPTARIESTRTGWPNIARTSSGETVLAHNTVSEKLQLSSRPTVGSGTWDQSLTSLNNPIPTGNWWPRMVSGGSDGNSIHALSITYPVGNGGTTYLGLDGALLYARSTDGGQTWDKNQVQIPGMDSLKYRGFSGDGYAIDAKGNTVAVVTGDLMDDVVLWKSTDNGDNWTSTIIWDMNLPEPYDFGPALSDTNADGIADTLLGTGGSLAVLIDNNDKVHVFFDLLRQFDDTVSTEGYFSSFPYANPGLAHWVETLPDSLNLAGEILDVNGDGQINFFADANNDGANEFGRYGTTGLVAMPSVAVDASNNLIVSYAAMIENGFNDFTLAYRHTYLRKSIDGGITWGSPVDVYTDTITEVVYGNLARTADSDAHLVYMRDGSPGHGVPPTSGSADPNNGYGDFIYINPRVADLPSGINERNSAFNLFSIFPNPANDKVSVQINNKNASNLSIQVIDVLGKEVSSYESSSPAAVHYASIDVSNLPSGIYLVKAEMSGETITKKIQVK